jgi:hypothetical protein
VRYIGWKVLKPYGLQEHIPLLSRPKEVKRSIYLLFSKINTGTFFRKVVFWEQWQKKHKSPLAEEMNEFVSFCTRFALSFDKISYISAKFK